MSSSGNVQVDFAISYAGEDAHIASRLATRLQELGFSVFFADAAKPYLAGVDGESFFEWLFAHAKEVVVIVSEHYRRKPWPRFEWDVIQRRDAEHRFLPVRLDDTLLVGLPGNQLYVDARAVALDDIVKTCVKRLLLYERAHDIRRPSEFEVILQAIKHESAGSVAKGFQLVMDGRTRTPLADAALPLNGVPRYEVFESEWCDFSRVRRLNLKMVVPTGLSLEELTFNLKHAVIMEFNRHKPDAIMVFAYKDTSSYEDRRWGYNAGRAIFAPQGRWERAMDGFAYNLPVSEFELRIDVAPGYLSSGREATACT